MSCSNECRNSGIVRNGKAAGLGDLGVREADRAEEALEEWDRGGGPIAFGRMGRGFNINQPHGFLYFQDDNSELDARRIH